MLLAKFVKLNQRTFPNIDVTELTLIPDPAFRPALNVPRQITTLVFSAARIYGGLSSEGEGGGQVNLDVDGIWRGANLLLL